MLSDADLSLCRIVDKTVLDTLIDYQLRNLHVNAIELPQLQGSIEYLQSQEALNALRKDPYWPKWDGPWWHMMLMFEVGRATEIPRNAIDLLIDGLKRLVPFFPFTEHEVPIGKDCVADVACHCQLGCVYQVLRAAGIDLDSVFPWIRRWFREYQLPDGGFNCDEAAYTRLVPRSSVVSTVPVLEALLVAPDRLSEEEKVLDRGAQYLLDRRLFRSISRGGKPIDQDWLKLVFPRFYQYDVLRGLSFVVEWAFTRKVALPISSIEEVLLLVSGGAKLGGIVTQRQVYSNTKTRIKHDDGSWSTGQEALAFPALIAVSQNGPSVVLTEHWRRVLLKLRELSDSGLLNF